MKKIILSLAIAVSAITAGYAQTTDRKPVDPAQRAERVASQLQQKLSLTDAQKAEVYKIEVEKLKKQADWRKERSKEMKKVSEARKAEMQASEEKLAKVLTADQKAKYESMKAERKEKMKDRQPRKGRRPMERKTTSTQNT
jgi:protein CpxP